MIGIISLLTDNAYLDLARLQRELRHESDLNLTGFTRPHVTFLLSDAERVSAALAARISAFAAELAPISVRLTGLGLFCGPEPVLYSPVPRNPDLDSVHHALCELVGGLGEVIHMHYRPENWIPHVTLVNRGLTAGSLPKVLQTLLQRSFDHTCTLNGFCVAHEVAPDCWEICREFPFGTLDLLRGNPFGLVSRPCQPSDHDFVRRLVETTLKPLVSVYFTWDEALYEQNWAQNWRKKVTILHEGYPVGYIQYDPSPPDHLYIAGLFLTPEVHGRGWGAWLLRFMEQLAAGRPVRLHVWENNPAVDFYRQHGYRILSTHGHKHLMEKAALL